MRPRVNGLSLIGRWLAATLQLFAIMAAVCLQAGDAAAAGRQVDLGFSVAAGYDSNPLQLSADRRSGPNSSLGMDFQLSDQWTHRVGYFVSTSAAGRFDSSDTSNADTAQAGVQAGLAFLGFERGDRRFTMALGGSYAISRSTFVDPTTGEVYAIVSDPNTVPATSVAIPDRFNVNTPGAFLNLRLRLSRSLLLILDSEWNRANYVADYTDVTTLESLDDRSVRIHPGLRWNISDSVRLEFSLDWARRRYDEMSAVDENAVPVAGTRRQYQFLGSRVALVLDPHPKWNLTIGAQGTERQDSFAGYYDSVGTSGFVAVRFAATPRLRFTMAATQVDYRYDTASIDSTPNGVRLGSGTFNGQAVAERDLGNHMRLFVEAGTLHEDNRDPMYAYSRTWAQTGVRFSL